MFLQKRNLNKSLERRIRDLHDNFKPDAVFMTQTSATLFGWTIKEAWKKAWPDERPPKILTIDPHFLVSPNEKDFEKYRGRFEQVVERTRKKLGPGLRRIAVIDENITFFSHSLRGETPTEWYAPEGRSKHKEEKWYAHDRDSALGPGEFGLPGNEDRPSDILDFPKIPFDIKNAYTQREVIGVDKKQLEEMKKELDERTDPKANRLGNKRPGESVKKQGNGWRTIQK